MNRTVSLLALLLAATAARADKLVLVAGGGDGGDGSPAASAKLVQPFGVDFGPDGTTYVVEMAKGERLRAIDGQGRLVTLAGAAGVKGHEGDGGPSAKAKFNGMHSLAVGPDGCVYLADTWNNCVRKFDPKGGTVSAVAGTGEKGFSGDAGPAVKAKFGGCFCVSFDPAGKNLYITDLDNRRIRKVDLATGTVNTVAGNGQRGVPKDGADAVSQPLVDPRAHAVDAKGNLYILERGGHALRVVDPQGKIRTVAGGPLRGSSGVGRLAIDRADLAGVVGYAVLAGGGAIGGKAIDARMNGPKHLCIDKDGTVLIADTENHLILRYLPAEERVVLVAGTGKKGTAGVGGDPLKAEFNQPHGVIVHPKTGEIYISDASNGRVLKVVRE